MGPPGCAPVRAGDETARGARRWGGPVWRPRRRPARLGRLARELARASGAVEPDGRAHLAEVAGDEAAAKDPLRPREVGDACRDRAARERLDDRERGPPTRELAQDDPLQRRIVLTEDEVAEALAYLTLDRRELPADVLHVRAAHRQLGLELRVVGPEAELHAAIGHELLHAPQQGVDVRFAEPVRMEPLQMDRRLQAALREEARDDLRLEHAP